MTDIASRFRWTRHQSPLDADLIGESIDLWERVFGCSFREAAPVLRGSEVGENANVIYVARDGKQLAGTCRLTVSKSDPRLGGVGEVVIGDEFRRLGLATRLCAQARDEFFEHGGQTLFLGTVNPAARRVYEQLGWRQLPGSTVMVCREKQRAEEDFLANWFSQQSPSYSVRPATADIRVPLIPLVLADCSDTLLDANAGLFSTRYAVQNSCMGLYPRYQQVMQNGAVFAAWADDHRLVGLATVRIEDDASAQIDGFAHARHVECWHGLIQQAVGWARAHDLGEAYFMVAEPDDAKRRAVESSGFEQAGGATTRVVDGKAIVTSRFRLRGTRGA